MTPVCIRSNFMTFPFETRFAGQACGKSQPLSTSSLMSRSVPARALGGHPSATARRAPRRCPGGSAHLLGQPHQVRKHLFVAGLELTVEARIAVVFEGAGDHLPVAFGQVLLALRDHGAFLGGHVLPEELGVTMRRVARGEEARNGG